MRQFLHTIAIALTCTALCAGNADARGRNDRHNENRPHTEQRLSNPGKGNTRKPDRRPDNRHHGDKHNYDKNNHRPGSGSGHSQGFRPPSHNGNNRPNGFRPTPPPQQHHGAHHGHFANHGRPDRPHMYPPRPYRRPTPPPPAWRPHRPWHPFNTILGVTLGTAVNISVNALLNSGYNVSGYGNDVVYLSDVPMLNLTWPVANLYYGNGGGLYGSEFVYSTSRYNMRRYNDVFNILVANYGSPYSVRNLNGGGRVSTWWGDSGQYITLTYTGSFANNGSLRYYTTLSFGR